MNRYRITNRLSGLDLGVFPGDTEAEAIEAMEREAGYADVAQVNAALDSTPEERRAELTVTEVEPEQAERDARFRHTARALAEPGSALRDVEFGDIEDYYPEHEITPAKRRDWKASADSWEGEIEDALNASTYAEALTNLQNASRIERAWGDDPSTREAARILGVVL